MASRSAVWSAVGEGTACPRREPEVFKTQCGKVIVVDELLHFLSMKMRTLNHDEVVLLATNNFSSDWIEKSKSFMFDVCNKIATPSQRNIKHTGRDKDIKNIKACLSLFNEFGEDVPMFVSHFLDKLPPVGFGSIDVSALLSRIDQLSHEVSGLRKAAETQETMNKDFYAATAAVTRRVTTLEDERRSTLEDGRRPSGVLDPGDAVDASREGVTLSKAGPSQEVALSPGADIQRITSLEDECRPATDLNPGASLGAKQEETAGIEQPHTPSLPVWSMVVKKGKKKSTPRTRQTHRTLEPSREKQEHNRNMGVFGTAVSSITAVTTRRVSVFATKFSQDLEADVLRDYLANKLSNASVTCQKIESATSRFGSFHITAVCKEVADMYRPEVWPAGIYVRRFFEHRKPKVSRAGVSGGRSDRPESHGAGNELAPN